MKSWQIMDGYYFQRMTLARDWFQQAVEKDYAMDGFVVWAGQIIPVMLIHRY